MTFLILSFIIIIIALVTQINHLLISLFCLEGMILTLLLLIPLISYATSIYIPQITMILLTIAACEASLGLRLIVIISRTYGSDNINSLTVNKC